MNIHLVIGTTFHWLMAQQNTHQTDNSDSTTTRAHRRHNTQQEHRFGRYLLEDFDYQFLQISTHKFPRWVQRHINPPPVTRRTIAIIKKQQERRLAFCARQKKLTDSFLHLRNRRNIPKRSDFPNTRSGELEYTIALAKEQGEWLAHNR